MTGFRKKPYGLYESVSAFATIVINLSGAFISYSQAGSLMELIISQFTVQNTSYFEYLLVIFICFAVFVWSFLFLFLICVLGKQFGSNLSLPGHCLLFTLP